MSVFLVICAVGMLLSLVDLFEGWNIISYCLVWIGIAGMFTLLFPEYAFLGWLLIIIIVVGGIGLVILEHTWDDDRPKWRE